MSIAVESRVGKLHAGKRYEIDPDHLRVHPAAALFPLLEELELETLVADVETHGQRVAAATWQGWLLDGRNRAAACKRLGRPLVCVEVTFRPDDGQPGLTLSGMVASLNLHRRHLTVAQRAALAAELIPIVRKEMDEQTARREALASKPPDLSWLSHGELRGPRALTGEARQREIERRRQQGIGGGAGSAAHHFRSGSARNQAHEVVAPAQNSVHCHDSSGARATSEAASQVGVHERRVYEAQEIQERDPELFGRVREGEVGLKPALAIVREGSKVTDDTGRPLPSELVHAFPAIRQALDGISQALFAERARWERTIAAAARALNVPTERLTSALSKEAREAISGLTAAGGALVKSKPYAVCPYCRGAALADGNNCNGCRGAGWVRREGYEHAPTELREYRVAVEDLGRYRG